MILPMQKGKKKKDLKDRIKGLNMTLSVKKAK